MTTLTPLADGVARAVGRFVARLQPGRTIRPNRLIIFTRYPLPGRAKTRLIPALGPLGAARLQRAMAGRTLATAREVAARGDVDIEVRYLGGDERTVRRSLGGGCQLAPQGPGDLGDRLRRAFEEGFAVGARRIVVVGADCPAMSADDVRRAFEALADHDLALGPADDGGYWLIGLRRPADVFGGVAWGGPSVCAQTLTAAQRERLSVRQLDTHADVDTPADLQHLDPQLSPDGPYVSVIIPALNEAEHIGATIESARDAAAEIMVVDGGSSDDTVAAAWHAGATVRTNAAGRARQMNAGAAEARGEVLLFCHADTRLPAGYAADIFEALADPRVIGGAFAYGSDASTPAMRRTAWLANWRARYLSLPYGDQALFVRREAFKSLGGFADVPIAEDVRLVRRLRARGRLTVIPKPVTTSARRYRARGHFKQTLINQLVLAGVVLGAPEVLLARLYRPGAK